MRKERILSAFACAVLGVASAGIVGAPAATQPTTTSRAAAAPIVPNGSWTVYHRDNARTGFDPTQPTAGGATTGWVSPTLDGSVYASPLIHNGIVYTLHTI